MNVLCIGPGQSALEYQDYAQFNNFDYKIGCRELLSDPAWEPLDFIASHNITDTRYVMETYDNWQHRLVTTQRMNEYFNLSLRPVFQQLSTTQYDNTYSLQARMAVLLGATHITTIGWDILSGDIRTLEDTRYRQDNPVQTHVIEKQLVKERVRKLMTPIRAVFRLAPNTIKWEHKTPREIQHDPQGYYYVE